MNPSTKHFRVGLLVPSSNTVMEPDFYCNLPGGWTLHTARMYLEAVTPEAEARMLDDYTYPAVRDLITAQPDIIVFGCTSAGALRGNAYDLEMTAEIARRASVPAVSVIQSASQVLQKHRARTVVVATPYIDSLNQRIQASLEREGLEVLRIRGLGITENTQIGRVREDDIAALARETVGALQPDALFVSCTNFPAVQALDRLREMFPFPVVTSNQAAIEMTISALQGYAKTNPIGVPGLEENPALR